MVNPRSSDINSIFSDNSINDDNYAYQITISPVNEAVEQVPENPVDFTRAQKAGQYFLRYVQAYVNTAFYSFPISSPYREIMETTATSINAIAGDSIEAFIGQEDLVLNVYRAGWKNNFKEVVRSNLPKLAALGIVAGCGYSIGLVAITFVPQFLESERVLERSIGLILDQELLRKPTLFLLSYPLFRFFESMGNKAIECFWPKTSAFTAHGEHYINSLQQVAKYGKHGINRVFETGTWMAMAHQWGFQETSFSALNYVLLTDMVMKPLNYFCYTKNPIKSLDLKKAAEFQLGPQHWPENATPEEDIKAGAKLRIINYSIWTGVFFFGSKLISYNFSDLYEKNTKLYYLIHWGSPYAVKFLFHNVGEIKKDFTFIAKNIVAPLATSACSAISSLTNYFGFFKRNNTQSSAQTLLAQNTTETNYGAIKPTL